MLQLKIFNGERTIYYEVTAEGHWRYLGWLQKNGHMRKGAHRKQDGRPTVSFESVTFYVYRLTYQAVKGVSVPLGLVPDHTCLAKWCIFPDHLEAVTQGVNLLRAITPGDANVGQALKTHCPQGHEYTKENTYMWHNERQCRECGRTKKRERRQHARNAATAMGRPEVAARVARMRAML